MITNFSCWKNDKKENEKSPDYRLSAKVGEEWVDIGAGWIKQAGERKYISFSLSRPYKDKPGFKLVGEKADERVAPADQGIRSGDITFEAKDDFGI